MKLTCNTVRGIKTAFLTPGPDLFVWGPPLTWVPDLKSRHQFGSRPALTDLDKVTPSTSTPLPTLSSQYKANWFASCQWGLFWQQNTHSTVSRKKIADYCLGLDTCM